MKRTQTHWLLPGLLFLPLTIYAAISPESALKSGFNCAELAAGKMPASEVIEFAKSGGSTEVCSSFTKFPRFQLESLSREGKLFVYVVSSDFSHYDLQALLKAGAHVQFTTEGFAKSGFDFWRLAEMVRLQKPGHVTVYVTDNTLETHQLQELATGGASLHISAQKSQLGDSSLVRLAKATPDRVHIYANPKSFPTWKIRQLRQAGSEVILSQ